MAQGWSEADVSKNYPGLTREDVLPCLAYAGEWLRSEKVYPLEVWGMLILALHQHLNRDVREAVEAAIIRQEEGAAVDDGGREVQGVEQFVVVKRADRGRTVADCRGATRPGRVL